MGSMKQKKGEGREESIAESGESGESGAIAITEGYSLDHPEAIYMAFNDQRRNTIVYEFLVRPYQPSVRHR